MAVEPHVMIVNVLRNNLTDINSSRSGGGSPNWIFPDFPRIQDLGESSYPRIGVTILSESGEHMGFNENVQLDTVNVQIDVLVKKDHGHTVTVTAESAGTISNSPRLETDWLPNSVTQISHDGTPYGTVTAVTTNADFTSPSAGTVEWSRSTGELNFSSSDLTSHSGETITINYSYYLEGEEQAQYLARQVVKTLRTVWRTDENFHPRAKFIEKLNNNPVPLNEDLNVFRQVLEYRMHLTNAGEDIYE